MAGGWRRRALLGAAVGAGVVGTLHPTVRSYLRRLAPHSGAAWGAAFDGPSREVESPHGPASVGYDDRGVPHVEGPSERATYFAAGYAQAVDRRFQMDLLRRLMAGRLAAVVGEPAVDSDEFHVRMDFEGAAEATWERLSETQAGPLLEAFADGVNAAMDREATPHEIALLEYEPTPWTPVDTLLLQKQIAWSLTGRFRTLRRALVRRRLGAEAAAQLFPRRISHDYPIIHDTDGGSIPADRPPGQRVTESGPAKVGPSLLAWLSQFEAPDGVGSNSWVVSGAHTANGRPLLANDPHLSLTAPPVWYWMHLAPPGYDVRGVTFPGVPFVVIGENDHGAWGFTNANADVIDFYRYDIETGGDSYVYRGGSRQFDTTTRTIAVDGGADREVTVRKTVHGPLIERHGERVGVAWTGHSATATTLAVLGYAKSEGVDDVIAASRDFDEPTQNLVYADRSGRTLYLLTGRIPIRRTDGDPVRGDTVFDGSAGEGEWDGFTPFGRSSWSGFIPFEEKPRAVDPGYVATANQRIVDDPEHYLAETYADPYRARRIHRRLRARIDSARPVTGAFMRDLQLDTHDGLAARLVPRLLDAAREHDIDDPAVRSLAEWDYRMDPDSRAALLFAIWLSRYREATFGPRLEAAGLGEVVDPRDWVLGSLPPDSQWFAGRARSAVMADALRDALAAIADAGYRTYGDYNTTDAIDHPLDLEHLNYPSLPTAGSDRTVRNFDVEGAAGASWRMIADLGGESWGVLPGGNAGEPSSPHYADQLPRWADGGYLRLGRGLPVEPARRITFRGSE